ncbi:glutathione hydrolase 5 proenzyme-like [Megalops cyprinoides]|uniref:glutathione hydrolase 5 proenzyme-like n=1 Tax=Megalops cyprinoides TaxID=118141 RepID=UPI0018654132|nr:glutathione hydrolase 5 proenzyme-like [Megalops cyprinoides]
MKNMARSKRRVRFCVSAAVLCVIAIVLCVVVFTNRVYCDGGFKHAAVSADSETCSEIGRDILQQGGSAVDGAIATLLCTSLVNPQSMGLGGGAIFTVLEKTGKVKVINSRETVPKVFNPDLIKLCPQNLTGGQWIGVPGEIRGYEVAHRLYGKLPWADLFKPAIRMAREGFPMPPILSRILSLTLAGAETSPLCEVFCHKNGTLLKVGDTVKYKKLADTLEVIAYKGAGAFYNGSIGRDLIQDVENAGGTLSLEDLQSFKVKVTDAWTVPLGDYIMHVPPPPAGGALIAFILNIMKGFSLSPASMEGDQTTLTYHRYVEACKFANGQKKYVLDPSFNSDSAASRLIREEFAERIRSMISGGTHDFQYYNVSSSLDSQGTTHVSVLAEDGTAVSVTSTINHIFGSRVYSNKTGIILNNELADFCGKVDHISAGEQPPSSMSPLVLYSNSREKTLVIGGSGGGMIITGVALTLMNHLWFGMDLEEAISAPVVFVDSKNSLKFEPKFNKTVVEALKALGHTVAEQKIFYNVVNAVAKKGSCINAVSDARKQGKAAGY